MLGDKTIERKLLLKRAFSKRKLLEIGKELKVAYFNRFRSEWDIEDDKAALEIAMNASDEQLKEIFRTYEPRKWEVFRGRHYTFDGILHLEGSWKEIQAAIAQTKRKYGKTSLTVLKCLIDHGKGCSLRKIQAALPEGVDSLPILSDLENLKVIITSYKGKELQEWKILEETSPVLQWELETASSLRRKANTDLKDRIRARVDPIVEEQQLIRKMDLELNEYLNQLVKHRIEETLSLGKVLSISRLAQYLKDLFGPVLYFDSLLTITQQYGLADLEIVHADGRTGMRTGWNLSLFGEPGTGKSFSTRDIVLGKQDAKVPAHGIPGRNRYAGGMTPARFIRIGQAYSGKVFNFIIPEFNDWFKYKGMVEPLKLAMERGELKYETHREMIGPYRLSSYFSVNYNVAGLRRGYEVTVQDPNFKAIEDRMLCRLHRLTKQRFIEIAESQMRLAFGEIDVEKGAQKIRDHLSLVYAIETQHPLVCNRFSPKPVMLTSKAQEMLMKARKAILEEIQGETVGFSARLEDHAIRFACAASLLSYFQSSLDYIPVNEEALEYAIQLYVEEASVRSEEEFMPDSVLRKIQFI
ncbi:MAG: hypothetical protein NWF11_07980 [Candidatus Bathyarchaeota archaeon]|nr:hypothetical protein [Candidatus Bathyarchaeota archaeon]